MAIDPNSINPDEIKKLVVEGLDFRPDGGLSVQRLQTNADPAIGEKEMEAVRKTAKSWRELHKDSQLGDLTEDERLLRQAAAKRLCDELLAELAQVTSSPPAIAAAAVASTAPPLRPTTLREGFDQYLKSKKKIVQSTKDAYTESFELFAELIGGDHRLAHEIRPVEIKEFNDALAFIPLHARKRGIKLGTTQAILKHPPKLEDKKGNPIDAISGNSANLCVANIKSFFDCLIKSGRRDGDNPFENLPKHSDGHNVGGADGFDEHELRAIFNSTTFMLAKRPSQFWGLLLALYTGARLNEIASLDLIDFVEEKGIRCIAIRHIPRAAPHTIEHQRNPRSAKRTKNLESRRLVPLHPDLYEIGIETYIEDLQELGATRFFPTFPLDAKGKRERRLSHDGNEYLKLVGIHVERNKVMHSFRDTVCEMLSVDDMDDVRADQWTGHKNQSIKGRHYRRSKAAVDLQAKEGFSALNFPFIDIEKLQYTKGWWNDYIQKNMVD
ncbi:site-specific integrase [Actimicrobium antarcticum]